ncbi:MAG: PEP-CTERM sorting domain-containing protein [Candidatus Hydrogenedentes bacterium]|nr:PEP-CTERM sorting domain-containing protein [Candidatus Hydrogenedentota bacterium]
MKRSVLFAVVVGLAILTSMSAGANVIYDNGGPNLGGAFISDAAEGWEQADDFTLLPGETTITDVHWWGIYIFGNSPMTDTFTVRIFGNNAGILHDYPQEAPLYEFSGISGNRADTGSNITAAVPSGGTVNFDVYSYWADIAPVTLAANTRYWISIQNDTTNDSDDSWLWATSLTSGGNEYYRGTGGSWNTILSEDLAFNLTGSVVPEPASMTLLGIGIAGLVLRMRRKSS